MIILFWVAVLPELFLIWKVYKMDRLEKEPASLLFFLTLFGIISVFPIGILESFLDGLLLNFLHPSGLIYLIVQNVLVVALIEELGKFFILDRCSWDNPAFDHEFDGIVYAVCTGMGFALAENVMYVFQYGFETGIIRMLTAVPAHAIFAIFMGHYYGAAKSALYFDDRKLFRRNRRLALMVPVILHGVYDIAASLDSILGDVAFLVIVIIMDILAISRIGRYSRDDRRIG